MKFKEIKKNINQKGIALLLTIIVLSIIMLIATFITTIVIAQLKISGDINDSIVAVYAAESGIEWQLYQKRQGAVVVAPVMSNGASLSVVVTGNFPNFTIKSLGSYRSVKRQFEVNF